MRRLASMLLLAALAAAPALAQTTFPARPVKLVVAFPPGGSTDVTARLIAPKLAEKWGQPVVVENRPGAAANIGTAYVARSPADGHTMLLATTAIAISASVYDKLGYDAQKDLAPVTFVSAIPNILVVHPSVPATTVQEFVGYAKANPGKLNFAAPGAASGQRMAFELIKQLTGTDVVVIAYKGGAPALQAVLSGEVHAMIVNVVEAVPHVQAGKLRALATTTAKRAAMLPQVPTLAETVAPAIDVSVWQGLMVPAGTPADVIRRINADVRDVLGDPEIRERLTAMGMDVRPGSPDEFGRFVRDEIATWAGVAKQADIKPE
ncbi:MAG TPA: tripartite tricarboxylate transporter substrate binding protein [Burkholderiaceae bacterium]|nr:tripartite tricarboxylate transporter substrate binding protein [Burkholderiaceae bacterium]